ncbi:MAG: hypothetical protein IT453_15440 [Planctomycetes bacterium]|nr:hypothetical protein [Planctomycetota bacterium]
MPAQRPPLSALALLIVVLLVGAWLALFRPLPESSSAPGSDGAPPDPADSALVSADDATGRAAIDATESRDAPPPDLKLANLGLEERLAAIARLEGEILQQGATEARVLRLEALLEPVLASPPTLLLVLDNLVAGKWRSTEPDAAMLDVVEYGGCRALYWGLVSFHNPTSRFHDADQGRALFVTILTDLPSLDGKLLSTLVEQLLRAEVDGKPLIAQYTAEILELRSFFRDHQELFSKLFTRLGVAMTPEERDRFFTIYLSETSDPLILGTALRNLLQGANPAWALSLAETLFDDPATSPEVRNAIVQALVDGLQDPFAVADFLVERIDQTRGNPGAWLTLAQKQGGFHAVEAAYNQLAGSNANAKARELLVASMRNASASDLERIAGIAFQDPSPGVRGQALMAITSSPNWTPTQKSMDDLRSAFAGGVDPTRAAWSAGNLAKKAAKTGAVELRDDAANFLRDLVVDTSLPDAARLAALDELKPFLSDVEWELLKKGIAK